MVLFQEFRDLQYLSPLADKSLADCKIEKARENKDVRILLKPKKKERKREPSIVDG